MAQTRPGVSGVESRARLLAERARPGDGDLQAFRGVEAREQLERIPALGIVTQGLAGGTPRLTATTLLVFVLERRGHVLLGDGRVVDSGVLGPELDQAERCRTESDDQREQGGMPLGARGACGRARPSRRRRFLTLAATGRPSSQASRSSCSSRAWRVATRRIRRHGLADDRIQAGGHGARPALIAAAQHVGAQLLEGALLPPTGSRRASSGTPAPPRCARSPGPAR